ncbi:MAG: prolyl oligopeptidase family serine peptidase [Anaerolineae bacterium]|nr:prolyl oligopeptidase family serine peptidase [Phycisphaerae bacterium]
MRWVFPLIVVVLWLAHVANGQSTTPATTQASRTGRIVLEYPFPPASEYNKLVGAVSKCYGLPVPGKSYHELRSLVLSPDGRSKPAAPDASTLQLDPNTEKYNAYFPNDYQRDGKPFGLLVWIAPESGAALQLAWRKVLDDHSIIFIEPRDAPNESHSVWRVFMALETVRNAKREFNIDPDRVYVAGLSGGGRISSHTAVFFPEVFGGAFCMVGCNFYRDVPAEEKGMIYPGFWPNPVMNSIKLARANSRLVLLTGSRDYNKPSTKAAYDAFVKEQWKHVAYLEVPELGHQFPNAEWFEKGINFLDAPLFASAEDTYARGIELENKKKLGDACLAYESAARHGKDAAFVADARQRASAIRTKYKQQLVRANELIEQKKLDQAASLVRQVRTEYGAMSNDDVTAFLETIRTRRSPTKSGV